MISRLILRTQGVCRNASGNFFSSFSTKPPSQTSPSSSVVTESKMRKKNSSHRLPTFPKKPEPGPSLYRRISPLGLPNVSVIPVLDQWVSEGRKVEKNELDNIIISLRKYKRFKHALEISEWMTDKRYIPPTKDDISIKLDLINKVYGLEKAEEFYNNISKIFKGYNVDVSLLHIYCVEKSVDKAEAMMQKLRETGLIKTALPFNMLMNLYYYIGNWGKVDELANEMERMGIYGDKYSFTTRINAYAANGDLEGLNKIMDIIEADPRVVMDCDRYIFVVNALLKAGLDEKGLELLKNVEKMAIVTKGKYKTLNTVLRLYAKLGKKGDVNRIWKILKKEKIYNTGYGNMISSLVKLNDIEGAEKIFEEWEAKGLAYDFRIPDDLIDTYVKKGDLKKAEVFLNCGIEKGGTPTFRTWYCITVGYFEDNQVLKGIEALKNAALSCRFFPSEEPVKDKLVILLQYLEKGGNMEELDGFMKSLEVEGIFSLTVCERLRDFLTNEAMES